MIEIGYTAIFLGTGVWIALSLIGVATIGMMLFYILLGCFLDGISAIGLTMAVIEPIIRLAGFDMIWFGVFLSRDGLHRPRRGADVPHHGTGGRGAVPVP